MDRNLIKLLINSSEKAANIARKCRADECLLNLLVQEKSADEANPRFVQDFKTLADVLIQETIRHDVGKIFPELLDNIRGEETSTFTNKLGDSISVSIGGNFEQTADCLQRVLDGNRNAAILLAKEVHNIVECSDTGTQVPKLPDSLDYSNLGIWIDPIDATAEYIAGDTIFSSFPGITSTGLDCVTVLIGVFFLDTGVPVIGVVNQPFHSKTASGAYESKIFWGIHLEDLNANNITREVTDKPPNKIALFSSSEHEQILNMIKNLRYELAFSAGAGHKALKVITGEADIYILSKSSTFKWDTCGPQAILCSLGGVYLDFRLSIKHGKAIPLKYDESAGKCNSGGLIAVRNVALLDEIFKVL